MQAILTAIYSLYNGNAALKAAIPGGLFFEMSPQGTSLPYATYFMISAVPDYYFDSMRFELVRVQFDIYADTNVKRLTAQSALTSLYDDARPTVTGYTSIIMERSNVQLLRDGDQDQIFRAIVEYECRFLKS